GLAIGSNSTGNFLYATNFAGRSIDVFDTNFAPATLSGSFSDPKLPAKFAPFGIQNINGKLFVTYAKQAPTGPDELHGPGLGYVDVFDTDGNLMQRFAKKGKLNAPWGLTQAPSTFGTYANDILIGNFGDGKIHAYNPATGKHHGVLALKKHKSIVIDGLWALSFGGALNSSPDTLYFTAGPNDEADGLFGSIAP